MTAYPEAQRKAQDEIERVVGRDRLPTFEDRASLPYTDAIFREVLRLWPPTPLIIPRVASKDDVYKGYFIPKGVPFCVFSSLRGEYLNTWCFQARSSFRTCCTSDWSWAPSGLACLPCILLFPGLWNAMSGDTRTPMISILIGI